MPTSCQLPLGCVCVRAHAFVRLCKRVVLPICRARSSSEMFQLQPISKNLARSRGRSALVQLLAGIEKNCSFLQVRMLACDRSSVCEVGKV